MIPLGSTHRFCFALEHTSYRTLAIKVCPALRPLGSIDTVECTVVDNVDNDARDCSHEPLLIRHELANLTPTVALITRRHAMHSGACCNLYVGV